MTYNKLYNFLKNSILILTILIGVKSFAVDVGDYDPDNYCKEMTSFNHTSALGCPDGNGLTTCENDVLDYYYIKNETCTPEYYSYCPDTGFRVDYDHASYGSALTCSGGQILNTTTCSCDCPIDTVFYEPTQTCVPECTGDFMDYTSNGGCACNEGFTFVGDICVFGDDPAGDDDNDGVPNYDDPDYDNDGDGTENGNDSDWKEDHPDYENPNTETAPSLCDTIPVWNQDSTTGSWYKQGSLSDCSITFFNSVQDGFDSYVSLVDGVTCSDQDQCVIKYSACPLGLYYSVALGGCTDGVTTPECVQTNNSTIINNNGVCYENFLCDDGVEVWDSAVITCPVEGSEDYNNSVNVSDQQELFNALTQYKASNSVLQQEQIDLATVSNQKLDTINETLKNVDTRLQNEEELSEIRNRSLADINDLIQNQIENNNKSLGDLQGSVTSADLSNQNGLADLSDKLQQIIDKNVSSSTDLSEYFTGDDPFDGNYTDGSENFATYSNDLNNSFSSFVITDPLGIKNVSQSYVVPTYSFTLDGHTYELFGPTMFSNLPVDLIRSVFMFVAVIGGIVIFFGTV